MLFANPVVYLFSFALFFAFMASYFILLAQDKVTKHKSAGADLGALAHEV
jgi:hypothetical protein